MYCNGTLEREKHSGDGEESRRHILIGLCAFGELVFSTTTFTRKRSHKRSNARRSFGFSSRVRVEKKEEIIQQWESPRTDRCLFPLVPLSISAEETERGRKQARKKYMGEILRELPCRLTRKLFFTASRRKAASQ